MNGNTDYGSRITDHSAVPVLAIDGPSGSGKGTVGLLLAARLGWHFLDSGALYRALGYAAHRAHIALNDAAVLAGLAREMDIRFLLQDGASVKVLLDGAEVGEVLRTEESGKYASQVASILEVRRELLQKQRDFRRLPGLVADGRDMGTVVFPDASLKIFLTASPELRAERRYKQLKEKGFDANLPRLLGEIRERDARDSARAASPLKPAADAQILDTSALSISEVVDRIYSVLAARLSQ